MFMCAQMDEQGVCRTVARLTAEVIGDRIIPLSAETDVLGWRYDAGRFYNLQVTAQATSVPAGQTIVLDVAWRDRAGTLVDDRDAVTAVCNGNQADVAMVAGLGTVEFSADAPGSYPVRISAACGLVVDLEVTVV